MKHLKFILSDYLLKVALLISIVFLGGLPPPIKGQRIELPPLSCGIYDNVSIAEATCNGTFLMWGETFESDPNKTISIFLQQYKNYTELAHDHFRANVGPFYCQNCERTNEEGYGYVGIKNETLPDLISSSYTKSNVTTLFTNGDFCSTEEKNIKIANDNDVPNALSCSALQKHCEKLNDGWLVYAKTFETVSSNRRIKISCRVCGHKILYLYVLFFFLLEYTIWHSTNC